MMTADDAEEGSTDKRKRLPVLPILSEAVKELQGTV